MAVFDPSDRPVRPGPIAPQKIPDSPPAKKPEVGKDGVSQLPRGDLKGVTKTTDEQAAHTFVVPEAPKAPAPMKMTIKKDAEVITDKVVKAKAEKILGTETLGKLERIDEKTRESRLKMAHKEFIAGVESAAPAPVEEGVIEKKQEDKRSKVGHEHGKERHLAALAHSEADKKGAAEGKAENKSPSFSKAAEVKGIEETAAQEATKEKQEREERDNKLEAKKIAIERDREIIDSRVEKSKE